MLDGVKKANLENKFKKKFRPPAWRMSPGAIKSFKKAEFELLALSSQQYALDTYKGEDKIFEKVNYYNLNPPFIPLRELEKMNIVYHACEWDKNYLDKNKTNELIQFLEKIENKEFSFLAPG